MEKVLDYIYDFIGIFIPGVTFWIFLWLTTVLLLPMEAIQFLSTLLPVKLLLLADTSQPFIQAIVSHKSLIILLVVIVCYISGLVFSEKHKFDSKDDCETSTKAEALGSDLDSADANSLDMHKKQKLKDVYNEIKKLVALIDRKLHLQMKVDWETVDYRNKWIVYYRWANILSPNTSDRSNLQLILAKTILYRSLRVVFRLLGWYVCTLTLLGTVTFVFSSSLNLVQCILYVVFGCFMFGIYECFLSRFFLSTSEKHRNLLQNESILVLSKYYLEKKDI
ncbi:hypothetical protein SAMN05661091_5304 [Paenibacillus uliginis N3/975]|uniref:Uncharacterized protein n=1 Tax=Paenibacillus uliginis N3/975 TaxID=1313296 RepID=A0A1X7HS80_9BACL|nr:hypothetical protein [Paenibacillus uliginis]SMF90962.1 hypothetical protein SAMN05661091_5304 [Paenibacillus uliginis N3/975]